MATNFQPFSACFLRSSTCNDPETTWRTRSVFFMIPTPRPGGWEYWEACKVPPVGSGRYFDCNIFTARVEENLSSDGLKCPKTDRLGTADGCGSSSDIRKKSVSAGGWHHPLTPSLGRSGS